MSQDKKILVVYFTAESGRTGRLAKKIAEVAGADLFEIKPQKPYTKADLNYVNPLARCNREKFGKKEVPTVGRVENFGQYDMVLVGFPIWYSGAPNVVNSFCGKYDFTGKKVAVFATSGGGGIGKTAEKLKPYVKGADIADARIFTSADKQTLKQWVEGL